MRHPLQFNNCMFEGGFQNQLALFNAGAYAEASAQNSPEFAAAYRRSREEAERRDKRQRRKAKTDPIIRRLAFWRKLRDTSWDDIAIVMTWREQRRLKRAWNEA